MHETAERFSGQTDTRTAYSDALTIAAIGVTAYVLSSFLHEGVGHGGMCLLLGGKPTVLSSVFLDYDSKDPNLTWWDNRWIAAGGPLANFLTGVVCLLLLRLWRSAPPSGRYFLWLLMSVGLFQAGGYLMVSPFGNFGDWAGFLGGLEPRIVWQLGLTALGIAISLWALRKSNAELESFLGRWEDGRARRAFALTSIPYLAGSIVLCISALRGPAATTMVWISAGAATFAGTCWLLWAPWAPEFIRKPLSSPTAQPLMIRRRVAWRIAGLLATVVCIAFLGPSIKLR